MDTTLAYLGGMGTVMLLGVLATAQSARDIRGA
jgi:hypothetical protein